MAPFELRWGILATGWIAEQFVTDLHRPSSARGEQDISHKVVAAASSSSLSRAQAFLKEQNWPDAKPYGSYQELVADKNIDVVYVATPHSHHYQNARLCLEAGKHVLCEKSFTVNAAQTEILIRLAKEKKLFLMEAVWTRYFPMSKQIREIVGSGGIGAVHRATADLSLGEDVEKKFGTEHRMVKMDLAGGALLDLGIYSLTWLFQTLYHPIPPKDRKAPSKISAHIAPYEKTGADESTAILLSFPAGPGGANYAQGIATTSLRVGPTGIPGPAIRIQGTNGEIQVDHPAYRPEGWRLIRKGAAAEEHKNDMAEGVRGFAYEADEVARCIRDGKLESEGLGWIESLEIMMTMDEVRKQGGLKYPEKLESVEYPLEHW